MDATAMTQVPESVASPTPPEDRAAVEALRVFRERVFRGIRWSGWALDRNGDDTATIAIIYALEAGKPLGFNRRVRVPSVAPQPQHLVALRDGVVAFVEEFAEANRRAPALEIVTASEDPIFDASPMTQAGLVAVELSGGAAPGPEEVVVEDVPDGGALDAMEAERTHNEVMTREFGAAAPSRLDIVRDVLRRRKP